MTNVEKLIIALVAPVQDIENSLEQLMLLRRIDVAEGAQLDVIGKLAGQPRLGYDDEKYRRYIRARIATNNSDGTIEDLITVADLVVYDDDATYTTTNHPHATVVLSVDNLAISAELAGILLTFLYSAASAGIRVILEFGIAADPDTWFTWDVDGLGWDNGYLTGALDA